MDQWDDVVEGLSELARDNSGYYQIKVYDEVVLFHLVTHLFGEVMKKIIRFELVIDDVCGYQNKTDYTGNKFIHNLWLQKNN